MSLTKEFNQFAGKIVSVSELTALIKQAGFDPNMSPSEVQLARKIKEVEKTGQMAEVNTLIGDINSSLYLTSRAAAGIERQALNTEDEEIAMITLKAGIQAYSDDMYICIQPSVKFVLWAYDDKKVVDAFIKAAEDCTDHRGRVGVDLLEMEPVLTNIKSKMANKFGL